METPNFEPPAGPPPVLAPEQLAHLMEQGHLPLTLSPHLSALHASLSTAARDFFAQPAPTKESQYPPSQGTELGYYHVPDEKEYLTLRHRISPAGEPSQRLESLAAKAWSAIAALLYRVLADLSRALGVPLGAWELILDGCLTLPASEGETTPSLLRLFRYEPESGVAVQHRDNGILTLCVGEQKGLQVWQRAEGASTGDSAGQDGEGDGVKPAKGEWKDAVGPTLLAGYALYYLSAGRVRAGNHRVVANPEGRSSIVFALRPSTRHWVDLSPFGGEGAWDMGLIWKRISEGRVNVNAQKELREKKARERRDAKKRLQDMNGG